MTAGPIKKLGFLEKKKKRNRQSGRDFEAIINELKDLEVTTKDKDAYCDRAYVFAQGYFETPRLHLKWFETILRSQVNRKLKHIH